MLSEKALDKSKINSEKCIASSHSYLHLYFVLLPVTHLRTSGICKTGKRYPYC